MMIWAMTQVMLNQFFLICCRIISTEIPGKNVIVSSLEEFHRVIFKRPLSTILQSLLFKSNSESHFKGDTKTGTSGFKKMIKKN